jgi:glycerophosphoryl diester phosphodiesterase
MAPMPRPTLSLLTAGVVACLAPGDFGLGNPFAMPYVTIEAVLPVGGHRLVIVNDTNFGSTGRNPALPDYSDFIVVRVPGLDR